MNIRPVGAQLFMRTDRRTDRHDEANSRFFRNFVNAPKKFYVLPAQCIYVFCTVSRTNSVYPSVQH